MTPEERMLGLDPDKYTKKQWRPEDFIIGAAPPPEPYNKEDLMRKVTGLSEEDEKILDILLGAQ